MYKFENGISESEKEIILSINRSQQFIQVSTNVYYKKSNVQNNSKNPCYRIVKRLQDGKLFNVNLNNGIAYKYEQ